MDLNNMGSGRKLLQSVLKQSKTNSKPWTKNQQLNTLKSQKNPHTVKSTTLRKNP